jgi:hypothetical protein
MQSKSLRRAAVLVLAATTAPAFAATAEGKFERDLKVTGAVDLRINTGSGSIHVHPGAAGAVHISGAIRAHDNGPGAQEKVRRLEANPPVEQSGNIITIGRTEDRELMNQVSISYDVAVPAEARVRSHTGSGSQSIAGVRGPVEAASGSGDLSVSNVGDELRASTGSGNITLEAIQGRVQAQTGSGSIRGNGLAGPVAARTGSGSVRLEQAAGGKVEAKTISGTPFAAFRFGPRVSGSSGVDVTTGSGSVEVTGARGALRARTGSGSLTVQGEPAGEWSLEAGSGDILVKLPGQAAFDFRAHTGSGRITIDHAVFVQGEIGRRDVQGKVRGGGPLVYARTGSGSVTVLPAEGLR